MFSFSTRSVFSRKKLIMQSVKFVSVSDARKVFERCVLEWVELYRHYSLFNKSMTQPYYTPNYDIKLYIIFNSFFLLFCYYPSGRCHMTLLKYLFWWAEAGQEINSLTSNCRSHWKSLTILKLKFSFKSFPSHFSWQSWQLYWLTHVGYWIK